MMNLDLTPEQVLLQQSVREWGGREVAPRIRELDRAHAFDPNILRDMASLGLLGASVPPKYGGAGMDYVALGLACEELEYVDTSLRVIMSVHVEIHTLMQADYVLGLRSDRETRCTLPPAHAGVEPDDA